MEFINFDCPECGQNLDAPVDMAGMEIGCPNCSKPILIPRPTKPSGTAPAPGSAPPPGGNASAQGETIKKSATVRLDLPSDFTVPKPKPRIIKIKRQED